MVLFGVDNGSHVYSSYDSSNIEPFLMIITNIINDEIIESIDIVTTKNIIFQIPLDISDITRDITFDFQVDLHKWCEFASKIHFLEFRGVLCNNQFTVKHLECMVLLEGLYIGNTTYNLFDNEDISNLPMIKCLSLNGYGMVRQSQNMQKWIEKLGKNGCKLNCFC
jgi:hypothetical protein